MLHLGGSDVPAQRCSGPSCLQANTKGPPARSGGTSLFNKVNVGWPGRWQFGLQLVPTNLGPHPAKGHRLGSPEEQPAEPSLLPDAVVMAVWVFTHIIPSEVEPGAAMLRRMGAGTVMTHKTHAGTLLQINSGRDDVEQLVSRVLPSAVLVGKRHNLRE